MPSSPSPGIALLYLHLHDVFKEAAFLQRAREYIERSLMCLTRRHDVTFLCGDTGPLAVAAVVYHRLQRAPESDECINRSRVWVFLRFSSGQMLDFSYLCAPRLLQLHQAVVKGSGNLPNELLYGRVGYLYALVFVNQQLGQDRIPLQYIQQVGGLQETGNDFKRLRVSREGMMGGIIWHAPMSDLCLTRLHRFLLTLQMFMRRDVLFPSSDQRGRARDR